MSMETMVRNLAKQFIYWILWATASLWISLFNSGLHFKDQKSYPSQGICWRYKNALGKMQKNLNDIWEMLQK